MKQPARIYAEDTRRSKPLSIAWNDRNLIGRIKIDGENWGAVEWSEKRQRWCIEDVEGRCLTHVKHIRGETPTKDEAVALAGEMIRDGRMPTPQEATAERLARRRADQKKRQQQPSVKRRLAERQARDAARSAGYEAQYREQKAQPLYEMLSEVFDFADPELWKSNSFAALRPRLISHVEAQVIMLQGDDIHYSAAALAAHKERLAKAIHILAALRGDTA